MTMSLENVLPFIPKLKQFNHKNHMKQISTK